jgi:small subunit ribosomal protein S16
MLRIRLSRGGKKRQPHYRVVVADSGAKRDGRVVERIGFYDPLTNPTQYRIDENRALYWLSVGAQPSDAVQQLLEKQGTIARFKRFRAGETIDALVAEFEGRPVEPVAAAAPVEAVREVDAAALEVETTAAEADEWSETASADVEVTDSDSDDEPAESGTSEAEAGEGDEEA